MKTLILNFPLLWVLKCHPRWAQESTVSLPFAKLWWYLQNSLWVVIGDALASHTSLTKCNWTNIYWVPCRGQLQSPSQSPLVPWPINYILKGEIKTKIMLWLLRSRSSFLDGEKGPCWEHWGAVSSVLLHPLIINNFTTILSMSQSHHCKCMQLLPFLWPPNIISD